VEEFIYPDENARMLDFDFGGGVKGPNLISVHPPVNTGLPTTNRVGQLILAEKIDGGGFNLIGALFVKSMREKFNHRFATHPTDGPDALAFFRFRSVVEMKEGPIAFPFANVEHVAGYRINVQIHVMAKFLTYFFREYAHVFPRQPEAEKSIVRKEKSEINEIDSVGTRSAQISTMRRALCLFVVLSSATAFARIGDTTLQFVARYGPPKDTASSKIYDKNSPLVEGTIHHNYEYQGWKIRAAFLQLDGPAVRMDYSKIPATGTSAMIKDYELQAIMTASTPAGMTWTPMAYDNPDSPNKGVAKAMEAFVVVGQKMWRRTDGAILWLRSNLIVRLELPQAREYEARLKVDKEEKARASVPQF
jgi:hypothetical protein